jgi:predicted alpha/beta superfamily hydrolase
MQFAALLLLLVGMVAVGTQIIKHNHIFWGKIDVIHSRILGKARRIRVFLPAGYDKATPAGQQYPVIYLFDGDAYCASVIGMLKQLRKETTGAAYPEMIVVAVGNPDRASDFTPTNR